MMDHPISFLNQTGTNKKGRQPLFHEVEKGAGLSAKPPLQNPSRDLPRHHPAGGKSIMRQACKPRADLFLP